MVEIIESFNIFINPEQHIPKKITQLTGSITDDMVKDAPSEEEVRAYEFCGTDAVLLPIMPTLTQFYSYGGTAP